MITQHRITKQEFQEKEFKILETIQDLTIPQLLAVMGVTNAYCWAALERAELLIDGRILPQKAGEILAQSGHASIEMSNLYLSNYLKKYWTGACSTEWSCRQVRAMLSTGIWKTRTDRETGEIYEIQGLGFLDFMPKLKGSTVIPPTLKNMDLVGMAILYRCASRMWSEKMKRKHPDCDPFELLPDHKGMLMVTLFDSLFFGMIQFNGAGFERPEVVFEVEPIGANIKRFVMWLYDDSFGIDRKWWRYKLKLELEQMEREYRNVLTEMGVAF